MIRGVFVINTDGALRLEKLYHPMDARVKRAFVNAVFAAVSRRPKDRNFFSGNELGNTEWNSSDLTYIFRNYATLFFVFVVEQTESVLGILDLIQVFVQSLDKSFENVCELDIIFNAEKVHHVLDEIVMGGLVLDTSMVSVLSSVREAEMLAKAPVSAAESPRKRY